ncbi:formyltransferase family protein [Leisingera sp. S232]|uniref:formyltransferase family protein n=1 Tax=Leisingera sp. S232 TaxID=3415132 RepID=UPI003C7EB56A
MTGSAATARIILICHNVPFGRAMAAAMRARFGSALHGILAIERPVSLRQRLRRTLAAAWRATPLERRVKRLEARLAREAARAFDCAAAPPRDWPPGAAVHICANPNASASAAWLAAQHPDLIAVTGAPVLKPTVFTLPRLGTLNMHSSLLPAYRGTQAEFWQVLEQDWQSCGITVHFVDVGVDTGRIVLQRRTEGAAGLSPQMLRTRNLLQALHLVPDAAAAVLEGHAHPVLQGPGPKARRSRDRTLAARAALLRRLGYLPGSGTPGPVPHSAGRQP